MIYNEVGTRKPLAGDICRISNDCFTLTDLEFRKNQVNWDEVREWKYGGRHFEVLESAYWDEMTIRDTVTGAVYTKVSPFGWEMVSEKQPEPNVYLQDALATYDVPGRLQQIFLDADDLLSDLMSGAKNAYIDSIDKGHKDEHVLATMKEFERLRDQVNSVVVALKEHYKLGQDT